MVSTLEHYRGASVKGIAVGSSEKELLTRYGRPAKILHLTQEENWSAEAQGIAFQLRDGHVISWLIF